MHAVPSRDFWAWHSGSRSTPRGDGWVCSATGLLALPSWSVQQHGSQQRPVHRRVQCRPVGSHAREDSAVLRQVRSRTILSRRRFFAAVHGSLPGWLVQPHWRHRVHCLHSWLVCIEGRRGPLHAVPSRQALAAAQGPAFGEDVDRCLLWVSEGEMGRAGKRCKRRCSSMRGLPCRDLW